MPEATEYVNTEFECEWCRSSVSGSADEYVPCSECGQPTRPRPAGSVLEHWWQRGRNDKLRMSADPTYHPQVPCIKYEPELFAAWLEGSQ